MYFKIRFNVVKPTSRPANQNTHSPHDWEFAYELAETEKPLNLWPRQFAVHYAYELLNRPWLSDADRCYDLTAWLHGQPLKHSLKV